MARCGELGWLRRGGLAWIQSAVGSGILRCEAASVLTLV
jgi:hypothetical protein